MSSVDSKTLTTGVIAFGAGAAASALLYKKFSEYKPPKVWQAKPATGPWAHINKPTAGPQKKAELPRGQHPLQLYSLGTPNGVKVTICLEELAEVYPNFEYDAWLTKIDGAQFGSGFVGANPNSKIPCMLDFGGNGAAYDPPVRVFESASILVYLCDHYDPQNLLMPADARLKAECMNWVMWQMGSGAVIGGGFGHFYNYAPTKIEYAIDRFTMETKRLLDVLDRHLGAKDPNPSPTAGGPYILGVTYSIADMCIWPWLGNLVLGRLYGSSETFLEASTYTHVVAWAKLVLSRPGVARGRMVNRTWGSDSEQLPNRHHRSDFEHETVASRKARLAAQAAECNAIEAKHGPVRTAEAPGADGAGKEGKHVPSVCVSAEGSSLTGARSVMVTVPHGMDEKHFIERVWAKDQDGYVVACATFTGSDPKAELVFDLPANATAITAFECCNLHGVWASVPISV